MLTSPAGMGDLQSIVKMDGLATGIYEQEEPIYRIEELSEERKLFQINESVRRFNSRPGINGAT